jgi:regulator of sigma E protease
VPDAVEQSGKRVGVAGMRLAVDADHAQQAAVTVRYGVIDAFVQGARKTWDLSIFTLKMLGRIITGDASLKNISGPLTMADYAGQSAQAAQSQARQRPLHSTPCARQEPGCRR